VGADYPAPARENSRAVKKQGPYRANHNGFSGTPPPLPQAHPLLYRISGSLAPQWRAGPRTGLAIMLSRERVETVLDRIRPLMQADGGDIELVDIDGNSARVRLTGMCAGCPTAHLTLHMGVEMALRDEIKEFDELLVV
jgi:Fe-S cluster biogenesis protein NfuA